MKQRKDCFISMKLLTYAVAAALNGQPDLLNQLKQDQTMIEREALERSFEKSALLEEHLPLAKALEEKDYQELLNVAELHLRFQPHQTELIFQVDEEILDTLVELHGQTRGTIVKEWVEAVTSEQLQVKAVIDSETLQFETIDELSDVHYAGLDDIKELHSTEHEIAFPDFEKDVSQNEIQAPTLSQPLRETINAYDIDRNPLSQNDDMEREFSVDGVQEADSVIQEDPFKNLEVEDNFDQGYEDEPDSEPEDLSEGLSVDIEPEIENEPEKESKPEEVQTKEALEKIIPVIQPLQERLQEQKEILESALDAPASDEEIQQ